MTPREFYDDLLRKIGVEKTTMDDARTRRDELRAILEREVGARISGTDSFGAGALAQGTQIRPLNDVDVVVRVPRPLSTWVTNPLQAMTDVASWIRDEIDGRIELSTHAIKISFRDEDFTADVVVGWRQAQGILLPHCPKNERHDWIASDPEGHRELVLGRNKDFADFGPSIFSKQIRILKWWNLEQKLRDDDERKPVASFHMTALALHILKAPMAFEEWTPLFFKQASHLVLSPLEDPSGVGDDLEAKDPAYASVLMSDAAQKTARALVVSEAEAERLLTDVFGDPDLREALIGKAPVSVDPSGALVGGAVVAGGRAIPAVRSHGDGQ